MHSIDRADLGRVVCAHIAVFGLLIALLLHAAPASADETRASILLDSALTVPIGDVSRLGVAAGPAVELRLRPTRDDFSVSAGALAAFGLWQPRASTERRDVYDLHLEIGWRPHAVRTFAPVLSAGFDVLSLSSWRNGTAERGTSVGVHVRFDLMAVPFASAFVFHAGVSYLAAIAPGTGDDVQMLCLTLGIGFDGEPSSVVRRSTPTPTDRSLSADHVEGQRDEAFSPIASFRASVQHAAQSALQCQDGVRARQVSGSSLREQPFGTPPAAHVLIEVQGCGRTALLYCSASAATAPSECVVDSR